MIGSANAGGPVNQMPGGVVPAMADGLGAVEGDVFDAGESAKSVARGRGGDSGHGGGGYAAAPAAVAALDRPAAVMAAGAGKGTLFAGIDAPDGIALGSDGALWFTNGGNNSIGLRSRNICRRNFGWLSCHGVLTV